MWLISSVRDHRNGASASLIGNTRLSKSTQIHARGNTTGNLFTKGDDWLLIGLQMAGYFCISVFVLIMHMF